jgi:hypothetical protein
MTDLQATGLAVNTAGAGSNVGQAGAAGAAKLLKGTFGAAGNADDAMRVVDATISAKALGKVASKASTGLGALSIGITITDGLSGKWKPHHTADVALGVIQTFCLGSGPAGWGIGLGYFIADAISQATTGKSITENIFD